MSVKAILNKTSRKKRNGMLSFSNTNAQGQPQTMAQSPLTLIGSGSGNNIGLIHFRPTAMDLYDLQGEASTVANTAQRTATTCFMRGLAENIRIETSSGSPWFHRRICITSRDYRFYTLTTGDPSGVDTLVLARGSIITSNGWQRLAANTNGIPLTQSTWLALLFKGQQGRDWDDYITAPIDTNRVDLKYDKTSVYKSGNERGVLIERKLWHGMNKNLVYQDDEDGDGLASETSSVTDKRGMGNYHIFDFFSQGSSGSTSDLLKVRYTSTMYWHEK